MAVCAELRVVTLNLEALRQDCTFASCLPLLRLLVSCSAAVSSLVATYCCGEAETLGRQRQYLPARSIPQARTRQGERLALSSDGADRAVLSAAWKFVVAKMNICSP